MKRPVLMSRLIAERIGVLERWTLVEPRGYEGGMGVAEVTEQELLDASGAVRVEWGEPDALGRWTPTLYSEARRAVIP